MGTHPHRIDPIVREERRRSRNCLRVDYITDGIEPRCNLRPKDDIGEWVLENRPYHLREMIENFDYCINAEGCDSCRIARRVYAEIAKADVPFFKVNIQVYRERLRGKQSQRFEVTTLGRCTWYAIYTGNDFQSAVDWVKAHGGALGGHGEDAWGRYRKGFVNGWLIPEELRPPQMDGVARQQ